MAKTCTACTTPLGPRNKTGLCRGCFLREINSGPEAQARRVANLRRTIGAPEYRERLIAQRTLASRSRMAWCPPEYRAEYQFLTRVKMLSAAEARRAIEAELPGTHEHAKRVVASNQLNMRLKHERDQMQAY